MHKTKEARAKYQREWRLRNRDKADSYVKRWQMANAEKEREYKLRSYQRNRDKILNRNRDHNLKRLYGINTVLYDRMFRAQLGLCAICQKPPSHGRRLDVDHDHNTGRVRGLLCLNCNRKIESLEDSEWVLKGLAYLGKP